MNKPLTELSERLRTARIAAGYKTAKAFVETHHLSAPSYSLHETGKRAPSNTTLQRYSELLKVNLAWLTLGEGQPFSSTDELAHRTMAMLRPPAAPNSHSLEGVSETLLAELLETLWTTLSEQDKSISMKTVVRTALELYQDIVETASDEATQLKMVKPFVGMLTRKVG